MDNAKVSRMTDEKSETFWSPFGMSKVRSRPESLVADYSMPALQPPEQRGRHVFIEHVYTDSVLELLI